MMDLTGWAGSALIFVGLWLVGGKRKEGFLLAFLGECFWVQRGINTGLWDLTVLSIFFVGINLVNYIRWSKKDTVQQARETSQ